MAGGYRKRGSIVNHINFGRLIGLVLLGAGGAFVAAFQAYLSTHALPPDATAGALLANVNAAAFDAAQKSVGAAALALFCALTRTDRDLPANGLRSVAAPVAEAPAVGVEIGEELTRRLGSAIAQALQQEQR